MISCTEFIPAYSELFKYLQQKAGKQAVVAFWEHLSDAFLDNLRELATKKGLNGCFEYWSHTLAEEAADFRMTLACRCTRTIANIARYCTVACWNRWDLTMIWMCRRPTGRGVCSPYGRRLPTTQNRRRADACQRVVEFEG